MKRLFASFLLTATIAVLPASLIAQTRVQDIFGRSLNPHGITLVDWDGYMANPLIKFYVLPPTNAVFPGSAILTANGARLYFDTSSSVSSNGPSKTVSLPNAASVVPVNLSIFPDRDGLDEDYTLKIVFTGATSLKQTNTVPIHVIDQDLQRTNDFIVLENFDRDVTSFFTNATARALVKQAAEDWAYFFADMNLDPVNIGTERTFIWSNNFNGGFYFKNTNAYTGYQLYAYGTTNDTNRSGGEASNLGPVQSSGGVPLTIKRSGGFEAEIFGNFNTLGWLYLTNDNDWLISGNLGSQTNDFYSIAHHEIGHAIAFNHFHPGFNAALTNGAFTNAIVTNYFGGPVPIDTSEHLNGSIDPESGQGAFGYEYFGSIPRKRWIITKLDLLCAEAVGYTLRPASAFAPLAFSSNALPPAAATVAYDFTFTASGGIPFYNWQITNGSLPPGLTLDTFTGALTGTPLTNGSYNFSVTVRDYHTSIPGLTIDYIMDIAAPPPVQLALAIVGAGTNTQAQLQLSGTTGQKQIIEVSNDLTNWVPVATNSTGTNLFQFLADQPASYPQRYYRAVVLP